MSASLESTVEQLRAAIDGPASLAIILGSGLGDVANTLADPVKIATQSLPGWAPSTATGHRGEFIAGTLGSTRTIALAGRLHRYEGHALDTIIRPIHVLARLGVTTIVITNAAGGINPHYRVGDIALIRDHIDLLHGAPPLRFGSGERDADRSPLPLRGGDVYDAALRDIALRAARRNNFAAHEGTYLATLGPNYETRAEYRMMRRIGADMVGMSTVPEVIAAQQLGLRLLGLSIISNVARPDAPTAASHAEVLDVGAMCSPKVAAIIEAIADNG